MASLELLSTHLQDDDIVKCLMIMQGSFEEVTEEGERRAMVWAGLRWCHSTRYDRDCIYTDVMC